MSTKNEITSFSGTIKETKQFLDTQPTQIGKEWVTRDYTGSRIYIT